MPDRHGLSPKIHRAFCHRSSSINAYNLACGSEPCLTGRPEQWCSYGPCTPPAGPLPALPCSHPPGSEILITDFFPNKEPKMSTQTCPCWSRGIALICVLVLLGSSLRDRKAGGRGRAGRLNHLVRAGAGSQWGQGCREGRNHECAQRPGDRVPCGRCLPRKGRVSMPRARPKMASGSNCAASAASLAGPAPAC